MQIIYIALNIKSAREIQLQVIIINHPWLNSEHGPFLKSTKDTIVGHTILLNKQDKRFGNSFSIGAMGLSPRTEPIVTYYSTYEQSRTYIWLCLTIGSVRLSPEQVLEIWNKLLIILHWPNGRPYQTVYFCSKISDLKV